MISLPDFLVYETDALKPLFEEPLPTAFSAAAGPYHRTDGYDADDQDSDCSVSDDSMSPATPEFPETPRDGVFDEASRAGSMFVSSWHKTSGGRASGTPAQVPSFYLTQDEDEEEAVLDIPISLSDFPVVPIQSLAPVARTRVGPSSSSSRSSSQPTERLSVISCLSIDSADTVVGAATGFRATTSLYRPPPAAARLGWDIKSHRALLRVLALREEMFDELQQQMADRVMRQVLVTKYGWRVNEPNPRREFDAMMEQLVEKLFGRAGRTVAWARGEDSGCTNMDFVLRWSILHE